MSTHIYEGSEINSFFAKSVVGKTIVEIRGANNGSDHLSFLFNDGSRMLMYHPQQCCEIVSIDDICGDIVDICGSPILKAEEVTNRQNPRDDEDRSYQWTFYKFATIVGYVDIKWYGVSNGYYSESVSIEYFDPSDEDWESVFQNI